MGLSEGRRWHVGAGLVGLRGGPLVIPLVLYQGAAGWLEPHRLSELLDAPADLLAAYSSPIELTFEVDALTASIRDDALSTSRAVALMELTRTFLRLAYAPDQITVELEHQVSHTQDPEQLQRWFDRALTASRIEDVFGG